MPPQLQHTHDRVFVVKPLTRSWLSSCSRFSASVRLGIGLPPCRPCASAAEIKNNLEVKKHNFSLFSEKCVANRVFLQKHNFQEKKKLCLSCVKLCAIFLVIEVVFSHKNTTSQIFQEIMKPVKNTTAVVFIIWAALMFGVSLRDEARSSPRLCWASPSSTSPISIDTYPLELSVRVRSFDVAFSHFQRHSSL